MPRRHAAAAPPASGHATRRRRPAHRRRARPDSWRGRRAAPWRSPARLLRGLDRRGDGSARAASGTARMASAARFMLAPRSPSPASESSSVSVGSGVQRAAAAPSAGFRAAIQRWPAASGAAWASPCSTAGAATWMSWLTRPPPGQARAPVARPAAAAFVHAQQRQRAARHVQRRQQRARPGPLDGDAARGQLVIGGAHDHVQLHLRRGAQAVDQQRDARAGRQPMSSTM